MEREEKKALSDETITLGIMKRFHSVNWPQSVDKLIAWVSAVLWHATIHKRWHTHHYTHHTHTDNHMQDSFKHKNTNKHGHTWLKYAGKNKHKWGRKDKWTRVSRACMRWRILASDALKVVHYLRAVVALLHIVSILALRSAESAGACVE